jgi:importin subunit alpha-1
MFRKKTEQRAFKKGIDSEENRRRRGDVTVSLRKNAREESVMKRRMKVEAPIVDENSSSTANVTGGTITQDNAKLSQHNISDTLKNLPALVAACNSNDQAARLSAVTDFRKLLSIEKNPPIQQVIDTGIIPRLVQMLSNTDDETLQFEAAWTLTNVASGTTEHTKTIIHHGAIQAFIALLASPNPEVKEQAVWALGNIAGDSPQFRDYVIQANGVNGLLSVFRNDAKISMIRNATWSLSNLCRGKPQPPFEAIRGVLPTLAKLVNTDDVEVITDASWALSYISDDNGATNSKIQSVIDHGVVPRLVQCLNHHQTSVQVPALRCIGNIVTGDDSQTQAVLASNPLPYLVGLMSHRKKSIKKEACWTVSNITAGSSTQIQMVLDSNLIPPLIMLLREAEFDIQKEAAWAISNATSGGTSKQIRFLVAQGAIPALVDLFSCTDPKIILVALEGVENILKVGKKKATETSSMNPFCDLVEEAGGLDALENLQRHDNEDIYDKSIRILRDFFEEEEDDQTFAPVVDASKNQFSFGVSTAVTPAGGFNF